MKSVPGGSPRRMTMAEVDAMTRRDRRRIVLYAVGALLLGGAFVVTQMSADEEEDPGAALPGFELADQEPEQVFTREFEAPEVLDTIRDATAEQRLVLSGEALDELLKYSVTLGPRNYDAIGVRLLDAEVAAELVAAPAEHRVDPLRLRGRLARLTVVASGDAAVGERHVGSVELDGGGWAHVAFLRPPRETAVGDAVRLDGLFVHVYSAEVAGAFREGPLVVGNQLMPSHAPLVAKDHETLSLELRHSVQDDTLGDPRGEPFEQLWDLMAFARDRADEVDWDAALELDNDQLQLLSNSGIAYRAQPFRVPISGNLGCWTADPGENGLRLDRVTRGWIGNFTWKEPAPVIQFIAPFDAPHLQDRATNRLVTARGFYLKNVYYEKQGKGPGKAPLFVMTSVDVFEPQPSNAPQYILIGVLVGTFLMIGLIFVLVRRDARSSAQLQEELTRRRRERRARAEASPQGS